MRIAVCTKVVPANSYRLELDPATLRLQRVGTSKLNPGDRHAVEEALRLRERLGEAEIVLVGVVPNAGFAALRETLAMGADRAVLVADERIAGSDLLATSRLLAAALAREEPDLVLFGAQSEDGNGALLWAAVAERLRLPLLSQAVELGLEGGRARIRRQTEHGYEAGSAPLPCVVSVAASINQPRFASAKGMLAAKRKPVDLVRAEALGVGAELIGEAGSATVVLATGEPPSRGEAERLEGGGEEVAAAIHEFLRRRSLIG